MSLNTQRIQSNIAVLGYRSAVAIEVRRFRSKGCSVERSFALAVSNVFGRYVA